MQKNITLRSTRMIAKLMMSFVIMICLGSTSFAQTTITTTYTNNNGFSLVTFNFVNNNPNPVMITSIGSISTGAGAQTATLYYKATPVSGLPPAINPANGWNTVATGSFTPPGAVITPFLTGMTFQVPANTTYGFAIETASLAYSTLTGGVSTTSGGGCSIVTGDNIGYGGAAAPASPINTPRGFIGSITFSNVATTPCTGTPAPGNTVASATTACGGTTVNLSAQNPTVGMGVTYQWQSSANAGGPFTNIAGATTPNYTATVNASLYYQVVVTCATTSTSGTSTPVLVSLTPASGCYCASNATTTADEDLVNVTLGTLNNTSTCTSVVTGTGSVINQYSNYTNGTTAVAAPTLIAGATYPMSVSAGTCGGNYGNGIAVFIDFNQNGSFLDAGEKVYGAGATTTGPHTETFNVVVPVGATLGTTRMRVIDVEGTAGSGITPCLTYLWGETEDYNVTIAPCTPVLITGSPASATVACGGNATFTATATGSQPAYQWQYRPNATAIWLPVPNAAPYTGVNTATLTITGVTPAISGYQYRAVVTGACAGPDFTQPATLTVGPFVYAVSPTTYNVCTTGGVPALISFPSSTSTATFTNNTPFAIPDASATGASSGINVSGIPVGATIQRIAVTFNMTHTYVGDVVVNLKSPLATATTGILNLVGFLDGGTGSNGTANFTGTTVASDGTVALSGFAAPRTGNNFKADALAITGGPTGGVANVGNWSTLLGVANANGVWTLYGADGFAGDVGTVTSWTISITYVSSAVTASFTPTTGLYTNAAATTPYTGGQVAQVYALPTTVGPNVYSAVVSTPSCTAAPQDITVNVNAPVSGTAVVANQRTCVGSNATFSVTGITGGPIYTYQWQVSTAAVPAFTNIAGATSATYTVTGATLAQSGNQYRVIVTGAGCAATTSVTSSAGTLSVNTVPVVVISSSPGTTVAPTPANSVTLTAAVSSTTGPIQYQWFRNNVAIAGATGQSYTTNLAGSYSVTVTDANGCSTSTSSPLNLIITSAPNANLFIYPSPNNGSFLVRYYNPTASATITEYATVNVYDSKGSRVYTRRFALNSAYTAMRVLMEAHGKGIYRVDLVNDKGERLNTGSVMIF